MIDPEKFSWLIQKKFRGRSRKNSQSIQKNSMVDPEKENISWSIQETFRGRSRKNFMVDPEKNSVVDPGKNA